jgi:hypothetical protein
VKLESIDLLLRVLLEVARLAVKVLSWPEAMKMTWMTVTNFITLVRSIFFKQSPLTSIGKSIE